MAKLTAQSEISIPTLDDLVYLVDDPAGTPSSKKARLSLLFGLLSRQNDFRLSLASGEPTYAPQPSTPASTDTGAETTAFTLPHGWVSGTIVTVSATAGGLTAGTRYYVNRVSSTVVSYHTTVADAIAGTNKVDLTASVTGTVLPSGISNTTLYLTPFNGNLISLYDGTRWRMYANAEISLALGTLTADKNYDVFLYDNSGTLTLELLAWTDNVTRATAIVRQDGVWTKTGALTRRYIGTIRTDTTTTTIDDGGGIASQIGGKRFVWNFDNRIRKEMFVWDGTSTYNYTSATIRQANGATGNKVELVTGLALDMVRATVTVHVNNGTAVVLGFGIGEDSTTAIALGQKQTGGSAFATVTMGQSLTYENRLFGYHALNWVEQSQASGTTTWVTNDTTAAGPRRAGITAECSC